MDEAKLLSLLCALFQNGTADHREAYNSNV